MNRVLIIAGSDSSGGAGIQADIKTITKLGSYAATAITALTAQNTQGVHGVHPIPPAFIKQQIQVVLDDIGADCIKIGMLGDATTVQTVAVTLQDYPGIPVVLDPVMVAKGGQSLLAEDAIEALKTQLIPIATVITPNIPEATALLAKLGAGEITDITAMPCAAKSLLCLGSQAVLLKGGHLSGNNLLDILVTSTDTYEYHATKIDTLHTHGTGCTMAAGIAAGIAAGLPLPAAVQQAHDFVQQAIKAAPQYGKGHGPLGHHLV